MTTLTTSITWKDISTSWLTSASKARKEPSWLLTLRLEAFKQYEALPWPAKNDERWKRSDLNSMKWDEQELSFNEAPPQKGWLTLAAGLKENPTLVQNAWEAAVKTAQNNKFLSFIVATASEGSCLFVPKGKTVNVPLKPQGPLYLNFIFSDEDSHVYLWEELAGGTAFVGSYTGIHLNPNAEVNIYRLQHWNDKTVHLNFEEIRQAERSKINSVAVAVGAQIAHHESTIYLEGTGAENKVLGVLFGDKKQNFVNRITQNHLSPKTTSDIQYRGALKGSSKSFFSGMVYIAKEAQQSDAYQSAKSLLLSEDARADAIPNLEILADDVKCSHGAAVGPVDEDQKYYLQTRGVRPADAEEIIIQGFFEPVIAAVPSTEVQEKLRTFIEEKIDQ